MALYKNSSIKKSFLITLFIAISLSGCFSNWSGYENTDNDTGIDDKDVILTMKFKEGTGWDDPGHEDWSRWYYEEQKELYDLSKMLTDNMVYIFSYSFRSDIDVSSLGVNFCNTDDPPGWKMITNWTYMIGNIKKYTIYSGKIVIIPRTNAAGCDPKNTYIHFDIGNRNVNTPATLSFYDFKLEQILKKPIGINTWTISGRTFKISDPEKTFAEILPNFEGKTNVLHIKPTYSDYEGLDYYGDPVIQYDLSDFAGEKIEIEMSMNVYLKKNARIAWQINSSEPYYPVICGTVPPDDRFPDHSDPAPLEVNKWIPRKNIPGKNTAIIPSSGDKGKLLYLSGQQIEGAEAYFANAEISINKITPNVTFNSVTANGSPSEPKNTTQLTLNFSQAIAGLKEDDITISGIDGVFKRRLKPIDSIPGAYTLDISGFTSKGTLTVTVKKDGYNISGSTRTTLIYYYPTVDFYGLTANGSTWEPKTTTELTLNFSQAIPGLSASNITLSGVSGVIKGTLSGSGSTYTLPISGVTQSGTLTVTVTRPDCIINGSPQTVNIIYSAFEAAIGLKGLTKDIYNDVINIDTTTGIISKIKGSDWGNWFSIAIPGNLTITTNDIIVVKYIGFGDAPLIVKLPNSYNDVQGEEYPVFTGDQTERTFKINASRYVEKMPNAPNAVLTFQGMKNNPVAWKLKIINITIE